MKLLNKAPHVIDKEDIQELIDAKVIENKRIEYKKELPGLAEKDKVEFGRDVSSFANASGGYIIFGIESNTAGEPIRFNPLIVNADQEILRIESMIRSKIEPRIPGVVTVPINLEEGYLIVIYIPKSWVSPHVMKINNERFEFYSRTSNGKYPLDYNEIRSNFLAAERTFDRIRDFRTARIGNIISDEMPIALEDNPKIVLHNIPISAYNHLGNVVDLSPLPQNTNYLEPIDGGISGLRYNFDGYLTFYNYKDKVNNDSYLQVFKDGSIESVNASIIKKGSKHLTINTIERELVKAVERYIEINKLLNIQPPFVLMVCLIGVKGYTIMDSAPIDREFLIIPEIIVDSLDKNIPQAMKPIFDAIWNSTGWAYSTNYEDGNWKLK
ncbi:ATP-binding protein [Peribacillus sp. ACCC06369]|uniref:AlbA family DNA-binding domain-containing protein n=1 Tax=Peribacillus sp. ACCC06369 TaxID=3055860 RepID=UPI0025A1AF8A|nr:ATP-binding protein [Peribacillus sp. ACCC06369]MDM5360423.1 ATP-binding protein [Peribacillus sp. ACCC06369]